MEMLRKFIDLINAKKIETNISSELEIYSVSENDLLSVLNELKEWGLSMPLYSVDLGHQSYIRLFSARIGKEIDIEVQTDNFNSLYRKLYEALK